MEHVLNVNTIQNASTNNYNSEEIGFQRKIHDSGKEPTFSNRLVFSDCRPSFQDVRLVQANAKTHSVNQFLNGYSSPYPITRRLLKLSLSSRTSREFLSKRQTAPLAPDILVPHPALRKGSLARCTNVCDPTPFYQNSLLSNLSALPFFQRGDSMIVSMILGLPLSPLLRSFL